MKADRVTNKPIVSVSYTIKQVRKLIIQNVMAYNNTQPFTYWKKKPTAILMCNTGPNERTYLEILMDSAWDAEKAKLKERQSKQN